MPSGVYAEGEKPKSGVCVRDPALSEQLFTVWQVSSDDSQVIAAEGLPAKIAVDYAHWLMQTQEARDGEIQRITITNEGNYTVFEWKFGEGLTFQIPDIGALQ